MRIAVRHGAYVDAARSCRDANHGAALTVESTASKLSSYAAIAGDDASSETFAHSYDPAARHALDALCQLTHALGGLGQRIAASGHNHAHAEHASAGLSVEPYAGPRADSFRTLPCCSAPSILGGDSPALDPVSAWVLDQVQGFMWPGADITALRELASLWRTTGLSIGCLTGNLDTAADHLASQRSPEIPHALDALADLRRLLGDVNDELHDLAASCDDYAAAVDDARQRTKDLLAELLVMLGEEALITLGVSLITAGWATGPKGIAAAARVTAFAHRFHAVSAVLRTTAHACATRARAVEQRLAHLQHKLDDFLSVPLRNERGAVQLLPKSWLDDLKPGWLKVHETPPGHTLAKHVGRTEDELRARAAANGRDASTFDNEFEAEQLIREVLASKRGEIERWQASGTDRKLVLDVDLSRTTGTSVTGEGDLVKPTGVLAVLIPSPKNPSEWLLLTAYPK